MKGGRFALDFQLNGYGLGIATNNSATAEIIVALAGRKGGIPWILIAVMGSSTPEVRALFEL